MPRGRSAPKRPVMPDRLYDSELVTRFINTVMKDGKKSIAEKIVYVAIDRAGWETFNVAIKQVTPLVEVKAKRVGGSTYQVPGEVRGDRAQALAIRWLIENAEIRSGKSMAERLAAELKDASNKRGGAYKKKEDVHRMAEANKAYSNIRL